VLGLVVTELAQPTSACASHPTFVFRAAQDEPKAQSRTLHHRWQAKTEHHQRNRHFPAQIGARGRPLRARGSSPSSSSSSLSARPGPFSP
jgi:hypothetical protein